MNKRRIEVPDNKNYEYALEQAYRMVRETLLNFENLKQHCENSDSRYSEKDNKNVIFINYLGEEYTIVLPEMDVFPEKDEGTIPLREKVLILHYLAQAKGTFLHENTSLLENYQRVRSIFGHSQRGLSNLWLRISGEII